MIKQIFLAALVLLMQIPSQVNAQAVASDTLDLELTPFSLPSDNMKDGFYKVETEEEYTALQNSMKVIAGNSRLTFPNINFKKYMLLGGTFKMNNCEKVTLEERLYELVSQRKIVYKLYLVQFGQCTESVHIKRWVLIKKKDGYVYEFNNRIVEQKAPKD